MRNLKWCAVSLAGISLAVPAGSALAQIDPIAVGQAGVHSATMRNHASRIARGGGASRSDNGPRARATCAQRDALRAKFGSGDRRIQRLFDLCSRLGY